MDEDTWMEEVSELLGNNGVDMDTNNDGWNFMFQNGFTPKQAIAEMFN